MTLTNGDSSNATSQLMPEQKILDHTKALEILRDEYSSADGLDAKTLLDSRINGGLTYNDFLVLPGYIGTLPPPWSPSRSLTSHFRLCCLRCRSRHPCYQANHPQDTSGLFSHGHGHGTLDGDPHGSTRRTRSSTSQLLCGGSSRNGSKGQKIRERLHPGPCRAFTEDNGRGSEGAEGEVGIRWIPSHRSVFPSGTYAVHCLLFYDYQTNTNNFRSSKTIPSYCGDTFFNPMRKRQP